MFWINQVRESKYEAEPFFGLAGSFNAIREENKVHDMEISTSEGINHYSSIS